MTVGCVLDFSELTQVSLSKTMVDLETSEHLKHFFYFN